MEKKKKTSQKKTQITCDLKHNFYNNILKKHYVKRKHQCFDQYQWSNWACSEACYSWTLATKSEIAGSCC